MDKSEFIEYYQLHKDEVGIYRCTGPVEHWITTYVRGVWGLTSENKASWEKLESGDIIFFHGSKSQIIPQHQVGIIGVGIVENTGIKDELYWYKEHQDNMNEWLYTISFSDIYFFGEAEDIDTTRYINEKSRDEIETEMGYLLEDIIDFQTIKAATGYNFPVMGSMSRFSEEAQQFLIDVIKGKDVSHITPEDVEQTTISRETQDMTDEERQAYLKRKIDEAYEDVKDVDPEKEKTERTKRLNKLQPLIKEKFDYRCQYCGFTFVKKNGKRYAEVAHIIPYSKSHDDSPENLLVLCPNHHKMFDYGKQEARKEIAETIQEKFPGMDYKFKI